MSYFQDEGLPMKGALFCFLVGRSVACNKAGVPMPPAVAGRGTGGALFLLITNGSFLVRKLSLTWNGFCCPGVCCWSAVSSSAFNLYDCEYKTSSAPRNIFYHQLKPGRGIKCLSRQVPTRHCTQYMRSWQLCGCFAWHTTISEDSRQEAQRLLVTRS